MKGQEVLAIPLDNHWAADQPPARDPPALAKGGLTPVARINMPAAAYAPQWTKVVK
jgi:hypothetical protein